MGWKNFFFTTWVVSGTMISIILALSFLRFFYHLPPKMKRLFFLAAFISFSGAIGMELVTIWYMKTYGYFNMNYTMLVRVEETLEMTGVILFIRALLNTINERKLTIQFKK